MCPACIASAAVVVAGAGSTGGILAVCIGKLRKVFKANGFGPFHKNKGEITWQQKRKERLSTRRDTSK